MRRREAALRAEAIAGAALAVALLVPGAMQAQEHPPGPVPLGLELYMPVPADNPSSPERTALGRRLFFDPVLSRDRTVSCASCHRPEHRFADTLARSRGVGGRRPARNTPSLLNVGYQGYFFWDGRVTSLEDQVVQPIAHPDEMGLPLGGAVARLAADERYRAAFARASGDAPTEAHLARALASYVRSLRSGGSAADRYAAGDTAALGPLAREGRRIFLGRGRCAACHGGPLFSDGEFHNTGVGWGEGDEGRAAVTGRDMDRGAFRTPSLRDVSRTAPYMHDGSLSTLEEVVRFYDRGGGANPLLDEELRPLDLSPAERKALVAFLRALEGTEGF